MTHTTEELENQIQAQDCELEYWFQQAENYAVVQIPADDLRAIIARTYAAVNALPELLTLRNENERLREACLTLEMALSEAGDDYPGSAMQEWCVQQIERAHQIMQGPPGHGRTSAEAIEDLE